jgi:MFS superfamily sulfate permease-like transporter
MLKISGRTSRYYFLSFLKHDFKASITVFFVALPLCLGISLASGAPLYAGLIAGIIGGLMVSLASGSQLSVSGPAAGLTAICAGALIELGSMSIFVLAVAIAGILQILAGAFKLGGFTAFIPSAVIKGMLAAIGVLLISKQIPLLIGYDSPDFWTNEFFNLITFKHGFQKLGDFYNRISPGAMVIAAFSFFLIYIWDKKGAKKISYLPGSFIIVFSGSILAYLFQLYIPSLKLNAEQYVTIPNNIFASINFPDFTQLFKNPAIWKNAVVICFVASLETLLSVEAIDKLDPYNRITPQNRELIAQGSGNLLSGLLGGIPITAVIVRSSANAEAGAKTKLSGFTHGIWLILVVLLAVPVVNMIPYSVLAVILFRTGYNLAKPAMFLGVYKQGREQFLPFIITIIAILFTDLLIGVLIGLTYSIYFLIKHTYRAGYTMKNIKKGNIDHFEIELALNVSFLNKKRIKIMLDNIPLYSVVHINGADSVYIDNDILEIIQDYKSKAHLKHIELKLTAVPEVQTIELH